MYREYNLLSDSVHGFVECERHYSTDFVSIQADDAAIAWLPSPSPLGLPTSAAKSFLMARETGLFFKKNKPARCDRVAGASSRPQYAATCWRLTLTILMMRTDLLCLVMKKNNLKCCFSRNIVMNNKNRYVVIVLVVVFDSMRFS